MTDMDKADKSLQTDGGQEVEQVKPTEQKVRRRTSRPARTGGTRTSKKTDANSGEISVDVPDAPVLAAPVAPATATRKATRGRKIGAKNIPSHDNTGSNSAPFTHEDDKKNTDLAKNPGKTPAARPTRRSSSRKPVDTTETISTESTSKHEDSVNNTDNKSSTKNSAVKNNDVPLNVAPEPPSLDLSNIEPWDGTVAVEVIPENAKSAATSSVLHETIQSTAVVEVAPFEIVPSSSESHKPFDVHENRRRHRGRKHRQPEPTREKIRHKHKTETQERLMRREMRRADQQLEMVSRNRQPSDTASVPKDMPQKLQAHGSRNSYPVDEFKSVGLMSFLNGFAPMGMLFVLMDILKGHEEGLVHVNQLAQALGIGKPSLLAQLENLEAAGLLRTISSSRAGRHIELLTPNPLARDTDSAGVFPSGAGGNLRGGNSDGIEVGGQFSDRRLEVLYRHLERRGISVVAVPDESRMPALVPQLASFMGKYYPFLKRFYERLKVSLTLGEEFEYSLVKVSGRSLSHTLSFCRMLQDAGFFSGFDYSKGPHSSIKARVSRDPTAINFLTGGWLEHYVRDKVISVLTTHPVTLSMPYAFLKNPHILLPGNEQFELDFLLCIGEKIFWIESKTGGYLEYLPKYSRVSRLLGLSRTTSMLVSVESLNIENRLTSRYNLSCCNLDEFPDVFRINLVRELQHQAAQGCIA